jgi:hypothetical protein
MFFSTVGCGHGLRPAFIPECRGSTCKLRQYAKDFARPVRLLIRGFVAALLCLGVLAEIPGQPAAPPLVAALITWFMVTGGSGLAPPPNR